MGEGKQGDGKGGEQSEYGLIDLGTFFIEERVDNMAAIKLTHRHQVQR